jgi:COMPASS component SWD3
VPNSLSYSPTPITTKKIILKTFFGNPETEVLSVRFDQEDQLVAAGCSDGGIKVYNLTTGKLITNLMGSSGYATPTTCVRWRHVGEFTSRLKGFLISGNSDGSVI